MAEAMAVIGLGIGAASFAVQIFDGVVTGYAYFYSAANATAECKSCLLSLQMQEGRLIDWGSITGLTDRDMPEQYNKTMRIHRPTIVAVLSELSSVLGQMRNIHLVQDKSSTDNTPGEGSDAAFRKSAKPTDISDPSPRDVAQVAAMNEENSIRTAYQKVLKPDDGRKAKSTGVNHIIQICKGLGDIAKQPRRLKWAMLEKQKFQRGLQRLIELTDYLHEMVGADQMQELLQSSHNNCLALLQLSQSVQDIKALLNATTFSTQAPRDNFLDDSTTLVGSGSRPSVGFTLPDHPEVTFKNTLRNVINFSISATETRQTPGVLQLTEKELDSLHWSEGSEYERDLRTPAHYKGRQVWIEWKKYKGSFDLELNRFEPDLGTSQHVEWLASLLNIHDRPDEFRVPHCISYFNDQGNSRFGFLYEVPSAVPGKEPVSLLAWLRRLEFR